MTLARAFSVFLVGWLIGLISPHILATMMRPTPVEQESQTLKIGALVCLTGECAEWGTESLSGMKLAVEELNRTGGVLGRQLELVVEDSRDTTPRETVTAFKRLRTVKNVNFIVGPTWTPAGLAIAPLAKNQKDLIVTSPSLGVKDFDHAGENLFNLWPHDETRARLLARTAISRGQKRLAIFSSQQPWSKQIGNAFEEEAQKLGATIVAKTEPIDSEKNLRAEALKIAESKPDAVFFSVITDQAGIGARELAKLNLQAPRMIVMLDETTLALAQGALEGALSTEYPAPSPEFKKHYQEAFGRVPRVSADTGYDTVRLYAQAIETARSSEPAAVLPTLQATRQYQGASGEISFDAMGGVTKEPYLVQLHNGSTERLPMR